MDVSKLLNPLLGYAEKYGKEWSSIQKARSCSEHKRKEIGECITKAGITFPDDADLIVCGSLARNECTQKSDTDWILLINGPVDNSHLLLAKEIEKVLENNGFQEPGKRGAFGKLVFSHELVHVIGGHDDSNNNMTQRMLLLIESKSIFPDDNFVRNQVRNAILSRYFEEDTHFKTEETDAKYIPRFLINDLVRFWRTMCVDYASKHRAESGKKWALRNIKLRFSRKLIFSAGLLVAFECKLRPPQDGAIFRMIDNFLEPNSQIFGYSVSKLYDMTPLEIVARAVDKYSDNKKEETISAILDSYDTFLTYLNYSDVREKLEKIDYIESRKDKDFNHLRDVSHVFQDGLHSLFFNDNEELSVLAKRYGLF